MSSRTTLALLAGLIACAGFGPAYADVEPNRANGKFTCPGSAAKQDWMLVATNADPFYCKLSVDSKNQLKGNCFGSGEPDFKIKASGSLKVSSKCEVTGELTLDAGKEGKQKTDITANMTKSQTTIIGVMVASNGSEKGKFGTFTAIRMEK